MSDYRKPSRLAREARDAAALARAAAARARNAPAPLRNLTLARSYLCNAGCVMCDIWKRRDEPLPAPELSLDEIETLAQSRYLQRLVSFNLTGGETFTRRDLGDIVAVLERHTTLEYTSLVTNGFQTRRILDIAADIMAKTAREIWINVSVDAMDLRHDMIRGMKGARVNSDATLRELVALRKSHPRLGLGILFTLTPDNLDQMLPVFEYARELDVQYSVNVLNDGSVYYGQTHEDSREWYRAHLDEIEAEFERLARAGLNDAFSQAMRRLFPAYLTPNQTPVVPCFSGTTSAYIDPYGNVYSCVPAAPWQQFGNLREQPFDELWRTQRARWIRDRIAKGSCKCLITCETSNALKFSPAYMVARALRKIGVPLEGAPYIDRRTLRPQT